MPEYYQPTLWDDFEEQALPFEDTEEVAYSSQELPIEPALGELTPLPRGYVRKPPVGNTQKAARTGRLRGHESKPITKLVGEKLNPNTGKYEAIVDAEGYEWVLPSRTSNIKRPYSRAVGYNRAEQKIRIVFRDGSPVSHYRGTWVYENCSAEDWYELRRRASTGKYMAKHILSHPNHFDPFAYPWEDAAISSAL